MMLQVRLFAVAREIVGADSIAIEVPHGATVLDVFRALAEKVPALERVVRHSILALDGETASADAVVPEYAEVALIPPVSGG